MTCTIEWNVLSLPDWEGRFARIRRSNILQCYDYAKAMCPILRQKARWGLIKIDGKEAGLVQVLEVGILGNHIHALHIDRGPLWFEGCGNASDFKGFIQALTKQYPKRLGRKIRVIPEISDDIARPVMEEKGFKRIAEPYQTIWVDLAPDEQSLRDNLKKNWRNMLARAEKEGMKSSFEFSPLELMDFMTKYAEDKAAKGYDGPNVKDIMALAESFATKNALKIGQVKKGNDILGYALFFIHGNSATYQVGWTSGAGKKIGAQNKLLFDAMLALKSDGITDLDLGGVNDETAKGVKQFKEGMGGELIITGGLYR